MGDVSGQIEKQNDVIRQLEAENNELRKGNSAGADQVQIRSLQDRMATYRKERQAIQTIMENKIKALADNIAVATEAVISNSHNLADPRRSQPHAVSSKQLSREVQALQRLVNAAITAL